MVLGPLGLGDGKIVGDRGPEFPGRGPHHARNRGPQTARFWLAGVIGRDGVEQYDPLDLLCAAIRLSLKKGSWEK